MAMIDNANRAPFGAITIHRITTAVSSVVEGFQAWQARRQSAATLAHLSPALLEDIGLTTADVTDRTPSILTRARAWVSAQIVQQRTVRELGRLSPAMLADIGLTAMDIERYRNGGALR